MVLSHVFDDLKIEVSKSPEVSLFLRFRKNWDLILHSKDAFWIRLDVSVYNADAQSVLASCRDAVLDITRSSGKFRRDDYKEFADLCRSFLNDEEYYDATLRRPGAMHKVDGETSICHQDWFTGAADLKTSTWNSYNTTSGCKGEGVCCLHNPCVQYLVVIL